MEATKRRNPVIAVLLSILLPGLGQMYNGKFLRGVLLHCGFWLVLIGMGLSGLAFSLYGLIAIATTAAIAQVLIAIDAAIGARRATALPLRWYNKWWAYVGVLVCAGLILEPMIVWGAQYQIVGVRTFGIPASSMIPALEPGDCLLARLERYRDHLPKRGEVIIFRYTVDESKFFAKRVIGIPGEELEIKDKAVFINGRRLDDPWSVHESPVMQPRGASPRDNMGPITIPPNSVFVMGDNRDFSHDSRFWGFVEKRGIEGKALFIYYSKDWSRIGKQIK